MPSFHELIKIRRKQLGLRQHAVAEGAGVSSTYVHQMEKGGKIPSLSVLIRMAQVLEIDERKLIGLALRDKAPKEVKKYFAGERRPGRRATGRSFHADDARGLPPLEREMLQLMRKDEEVRRELVEHLEYLKRREMVMGRGSPLSRGLRKFLADPATPHLEDEEMTVLLSVDALFGDRTTPWLYVAILGHLRNDGLHRTKAKRAKRQSKGPTT